MKKSLSLLMLVVFLLGAVAMNFFSYFFSDKLALKMSGAKPMEESENAAFYQMVRELCQRADIPMPRLYEIPQEQPNAFATGRNYNHSAVAVTTGIKRLLSTDELRGVVAHELDRCGDHLHRLHAALVRR